ncbi:hypothetical protein DSM106972_058390 [Dulcicalothrix desertica PCC 7102]|uniref:Peptidoglycan binding-like domain-containing protein n=1 Tax=Dulcicalothrix desertica PCC 7102 TaxID=232991 RepID=A0A3S1C8K7_9CYAN|nr:peptidoglycan-binding protein [Dulcicalothrix desertica]RUT02361.1 hypothetical protein DSM106972_058390 [Dulcicalothrix desertica PCC 7102]TWH55415.1 N-acetylmuramoyl-L-alanine amidase [Dulcicalothrix desertica PCC 7102]
MPVTFVTLEIGSTGAAVVDLQQDLATLNYYRGAIDGVFGVSTKNAVIKFQLEHMGIADSIVGYETKAAIKQEVWIQTQPVLRQGSQGHDVKILQKLLTSATDYGIADYGIIPVDGMFGTNTKNAVIKYQKANNLVPDGIVGKATWGKLAYIMSYGMSFEQIILNNTFARS